MPDSQNARPVYEVERDRHGITFSRDLRVGECVRVVLVDDLDGLRGAALEDAQRAAREHGESKAAAWAEAERLRQVVEAIHGTALGGLGTNPQAALEEVIRLCCGLGPSSQKDSPS